jgi:SAM-dependent methyltransferase
MSLDTRKRGACRATYDLVADEYVERIFDELQHKPLDRQLLDRFALDVRDRGPACDLGCGPGHVSRYLQEHGVQVCGIDLSPKMVEQARRLNPGVDFQVGDMMSLDAPDETWAGIAAFYSIIHIPRDEVVRALRELHRVLQPGGVLLLAFHIGDETVHLQEWWGQNVDIHFYFYRPEEMAEFLRLAGFEIEAIIEREPYPEIEHQRRRAYLFSRKPSVIE